MDENYFEVEASGPLLPTEQQADDAPPFDVPPPEPPPLSRKRLIQIGLVLIALVVVAVLFINVPPITKLVPGESSTTSQTKMPTQMALISSNINFGTVNINGKPQRGDLPMFFPMHMTPSATAYKITVAAPPFHTHS